MNARKKARWLYILAALPLIAGLFAVTGLLAAPPKAETATPPPPTAPPPTVSAATAVPTAAAQEAEAIPPCPFTAAPVVSSSAVLDAYAFSEPQVVMTATTALQLFQWLPDNQRLLIGRAKEGVTGDYVETFDLSTGETHEYAERQNYGDAIWLPEEQAVAFTDFAAPDYIWTLYVGRGQDLPAEELATDLLLGALALDTDGQRITFSSSTQGVQAVEPGQMSAAETLVARLPGQLGQRWAYGNAWRSDVRKVVLYGREGFYMLDQTTGAVCGVDFGGNGLQKLWARNVSWSADGRYIAIVTAIGDGMHLFRSTGLVIVDTTTNQFRNIDIESWPATGGIWSPDSRVFLALVKANLDPSGRDSLYLVDAASGDFRRIVPNHQFASADQFGTVWSPDGKNVAVGDGDRVFVTSVEVQP